MAFPVSLSPSPVYEAFAGIQWDPVEKLELTEAEKSLLRAGEQNPVEYTLFHQEDAAAYAHLLLKVLEQAKNPNSSSEGPSVRKVSKLSLDETLPDDEAVQLLYVDSIGVVTHYAISKLCEVIICLKGSSKSSVVTLSTTFYPDGILMENWRPLLGILMRGGSDAFAQRGAAFCLACILLEGCRLEEQSRLFSPVSSILESFVSWMTSRLQSSAARSLPIVTPSLTVLIVSKQARVLFDKAGGTGYLTRHLRMPSDSRTGASVQQLYELCYCLWNMTYDCQDSEAIRNHFHRDAAVPALVDLVAAAPREKIVRCALAALRNLAECSTYTKSTLLARKNISGSTFLVEMIGCGLVKSIDLMKAGRQWSDPDIVDDLNALYVRLHETYNEMSRFDVYQSEVESSHLQWGIVHTEKFFRENARKMEGKKGDFHIVKALINLASSDDEEIAAIACFDIGEFVRHYPNGRVIAKRLGARDVVLALIEHENPEVQRQALICISKMLVHNWQAVG